MLLTKIKNTVAGVFVSIAFLLGLINPAYGLPPSFQDEPVLAGLNLPVNLATLPDGRMLVLQKGGEIRIFDPQVTPVTSTVYMTITDIESGGERGLASLVFDPDFATNGYFYVYYTHASSARNRISRFMHEGNSASLSSEIVIWQDNEVWSDCCHYGGGLDFGPDGKLYLTTGEEFDGNQAQDLTRAGGKVIRINKDGTIPPDNPFVDGPGGNLDEIWAYGLRNPYRASWDIPNNRFYIGDVGGNVQSTAREEINIGRAGANYGWPFIEGFSTNPAYDNPVYDYGHTGVTPNGGAITAGFVYNGSLFPSEYSGAFFLADYVLGWIRYLKFDVSGQVISATDFSTTVNNVVALVQGPEDALYYADVYGEVRRIIYIPANQPPVISSVTATPVSGLAPLSVDFSVTASDPENDPLTYNWVFGDSTTGTGTLITHVYNSDGLYNVTVQVSDPTGMTVSTPVTIQVGNPPLAQITAPAFGTLFQALDVINFSGTATDPDETLGESNYSWTVRLMHDAHTHPVLDNVVGSSGSFQVNDTGHDYFGSTGFEIILTATDSTGLIGTDRVEVFPDEVNLNLSTFPAGQTVFLDGLPLATPLVYDTVIGFRHTVSAPGTFCDTATNTSYNFTSWSDGGTQTHEITIPVADLNLTANYAAASSCTSLVAPGLVLHLEADQGMVASGGTVVSWSDLSLTGNDLGGSGNPQRIVAAGLNNQLAVSFDGVDDKLELTHTHGMPGGNADRTVYVVANYKGVGFGGFAYGDIACNRAFGLVVNTLGNLTVQGWCPADDFETTVPGTGMGWLVQSVVLESGVVSHYKDTALIDTQTHNYDTNTVATGLVVGAELNSNRFVNMDVAAILVYNRALSAAERQQVDTYLRDKYFPGSSGGNQPPVAVDDSASVGVGGSVNVAVLANDSDPDGTLDSTTVTIVTSPANGTVLDDGTGLLTYTHDGSATTTDSFTYTVADDQGAVSNIATVAVAIQSMVTSGLVLQLDGDTGLLSSGGVITTWQDQSGMGNDVVASGDPLAMAGVLNGHTVVDFDGVEDKLERTLTLNGLPAGNADRTVFVVANYRSTGYGGFAYGTGMGPPYSCNQTFGLIVSPQGELMVQGWCNDFATTVQGTGAGWMVQSAVLSGGILSHYKDGQLIDLQTHSYNTVLTNMVLGAELDSVPNLDMQMATVLVYDRALTSTEQQQVQDFLQYKYFGGP